MRGKFRGKWQSSVSRIIKMLQEIEAEHLQITNTFYQAQNYKGVCHSLLSHAQHIGEFL